MKPGNVLVDASEHCYLCDFGLTKQLADGGTTVPACSRLARLPGARADPPWRGRRAHGRVRARLRPLRVPLGRAAFRRANEAQTLWAHMQEEPASLLPTPSSTLARGLAKEPAERYETRAALVEDARSALDWVRRPAVRRRRLRVGRRLVLAGAALIAAAAAAVALP